MKWLRSLLSKPAPLPAKDPNDRTLTASSTAWRPEYYCDCCLASVGHSEVMTDICNSCGRKSKHWPGGFITNQRALRKLFDGNKWVWQYTYSNDEDFISERKL